MTKIRAIDFHALLQPLKRAITHKTFKYGALLLFVVFVSNPEIISLVSVISVVGLDAFLMMLIWQTRDYILLAYAYISSFLGLHRLKHWFKKRDVN
jgi:hypothetical protein